MVNYLKCFFKTNQNSSKLNFDNNSLNNQAYQKFLNAKHFHNRQNENHVDKLRKFTTNSGKSIIESRSCHYCKKGWS